MGEVAGGIPAVLDEAGTQVTDLRRQLEARRSMLVALLARGRSAGSPSQAYSRLEVTLKQLDRSITRVGERAGDLFQQSREQRGQSRATIGGANPRGGMPSPQPAGSPVSQPGAQQTVEEQRIAQKRAQIDAITKGSGLTDNLRDFKDALAKAKTPDEVKALAKEHGEGLWDEATMRARFGLALYDAAPDKSKVSSDILGMTDDRPLYWIRLEERIALREWAASKGVDAATLDGIIQAHEDASRGIATSQLEPGLKRIFITGFDPFQLDYNIEQGNPSGAVAVALDGKILEIGGEKYQIQAAMVPVLHDAFRPPATAGAGAISDVERLIAGVMKDPNPPAAFITLSQNGGMNRYDLEQYYGRTFTDLVDNNNVPDDRPVSGASSEPFLQSTLAAYRLASVPITAQGATFYWDTNRYPVSGAGSGGDYFSNALPRLVAEARERYAPNVLTGHLHLPALGPPSQGIDFDRKRLQVIADSLAFIRAGATR